MSTSQFIKVDSHNQDLLKKALHAVGFNLLFDEQKPGQLQIRSQLRREMQNESINFGWTLEFPEGGGYVVHKVDPRRAHATPRVDVMPFLEPANDQYHNDETLGKVYKTLADARDEKWTVGEVVQELLNKGILFRERGPDVLNYRTFEDSFDVRGWFIDHGWLAEVVIRPGVEKNFTDSEHGVLVHAPSEKRLEGMFIPEGSRISVLNERLTIRPLYTKEKS